jgi:hypothetical protein
MKLQNTTLKIAVKDKVLNFSQEDINALSYYSVGDIIITTIFDGKKEEINLLSLKITNIRLFLANWIKIKNSEEKIATLFTLVNNLSQIKENSNNVVSISQAVADNDISLISFKNYDEFGATLISDEDIDKEMLLSQGIIKIDKTKYEAFISKKVEKNQALRWSDSKIITNYVEDLSKFIKVDKTAIANYIAESFYTFKSQEFFYAVNKLSI